MPVRELRTFADGHSRPFGGATAREVLAETLARRNGWGEIRPTHWADAGAMLTELRRTFTIRRKPSA